MTENQKKEFMRLILEYQDGNLSESALASFDIALREDAEKQRLFIETQKRSAAIAEMCRQQAHGTPAFEPASFPTESDVLRKSESAAATRRPRPVASKLALMAIAASIVAALIAHDLLTDNAVPETDTLIRITYTNLVHWQGPNQPVSGSYLKHQTAYELETGVARCELPGGGIVSFAGPASFNILDDKTVTLRRGRLAARSLGLQDNFSVLTSDLEIRDLGTAFGVTTDESGAADVAVFGGDLSVRLLDPIGDDFKRTLVEGSSVRSKGDGKGLIDTPYDPEAYQDIWPLTVGIDDRSGLIEFVPPRPHLSLDQLESDHRVFLVAEKLNQRIEDASDFNLLGPGQHWPNSGPRIHKVGKNSTVSSYLLLFQPENREYGLVHSLSGSVTFQYEIQGVAVGSIQLNNSDARFGLDDVNYNAFRLRSLENRATEDGRLPADELQKSEDGRQLHFHLHVGAGQDCIRVLVSSPEP